MSYHPHLASMDTRHAHDTQTFMKTKYPYVYIFKKWNSVLWVLWGSTLSVLHWSFGDNSYLTWWGCFSLLENSLMYQSNITSLKGACVPVYPCAHACAGCVCACVLMCTCVCRVPVRLCTHVHMRVHTHESRWLWRPEVSIPLELEL